MIIHRHTGYPLQLILWTRKLGNFTQITAPEPLEALRTWVQFSSSEIGNKNKVHEHTHLTFFLANCVSLYLETRMCLIRTGWLGQLYEHSKEGGVCVCVCGGGGYPKGDSISLLSDLVLGCSVEGSWSMLGGQCSHVLSSKHTVQLCPIFGQRLSITVLCQSYTTVLTRPF